jgi:hypothetical protein
MDADITAHIRSCHHCQMHQSIVSTPVFDHWVCHFGTPVNIISDQGKEYCARAAEQLFKNLRLKHNHTTAGHP